MQNRNEPHAEPVMPTSPQLVHVFSATGRQTIQALLVALGFATDEIYWSRPNNRRRRLGMSPSGLDRFRSHYRSFWEHHEDLEGVLWDAHRLYRQRAWALHPDRGGSLEAMKELNEVWARIQKLFAKRGIVLH